MAVQRLTIYLLRDVEVLEDALADDNTSDLAASELTQLSGLTGRFYSRPNFASPPGWSRYLSPIIDGDIPLLQSASASGLLVLEVDEQMYALTFGHGRSFLSQSKIERRFGLKVALNLIDERQIRSLDTKVFDEMVVSRNTQTSRTSDLPTFGVDVLRDILRAVTGVAPKDSGYKSLSGSDALVLGFDKPVSDLPMLLRDVYKQFSSTKYRASFGWIDHLAEVKDPALVDALDEKLVEQLRVGDTSSTHLAMPENLDWEDIGYFLIAPTRKHQYEELDLDEYLAQDATDIAELSINRLKQRKVSVKFIRNPNVDSRWNLYQCLVSEQRINGVLYALVEGRWFSIADSLVEQVDHAIAAIPTSSVALPAGLVGEHEGDYNVRAASSVAGLTLLDTKLVHPDGATTKIEFCDLLSADGSLVHVKRKSRSSTLSHLFAQGLVSAAALVDGAMRDRVRTVIQQAAGSSDPRAWLDLIPPGDSPLERDQITVTYAILANSTATGVEWLPFFSRLNLMQTTRQLARLGFTKVALVRVPVDQALAAVT